MSRGSTLAARSATAVLIAAGLAVLGIAFAAPASAHSTLISSDPAEGATLTTLPAEFTATFNENLLDATGDGEGFAMQIIGPDGKHYENGQVTIDGPTVSTAAIVGPAGSYKIQLRVVSADGHPVEPEVDFTWAPGAGVVTPPPAPAPTDDPVVAPTPTTAPTTSEAPVPEITTYATPIAIDDASTPPGPSGPPGYLAGVIAFVLIFGGAIAAATAGKR